MKLYIARHGRTNYNDLNLCNADPSVDVHLTNAGKEQARALADKLKAVAFDCIYVSELRRTTQTADIVNETRGVPVHVSPLLNDHQSGYEGQSADLLMAALDAAEDRWGVRLNGGESFEDVKLRATEFLDELKKESYEAALVVTSQVVVHALAAVIKQISNDDSWKLDVTQGTYLEFDI